MKKFLTILTMFFCVLAASAQSTFTMQGNMYVPTEQKSSDTWIKTPYAYPSDSGPLQIEINRKNGRCSVIRTSKNTGKPYRSYIKEEEISRDVARKMNIPYTYVKKSRK